MRARTLRWTVPSLGLLALANLLGMGCGDSTLKSQGLRDAAAGGQAVPASSGGAMGVGGAGGGRAGSGGAGGITMDGMVGPGGTDTGGKATGGSVDGADGAVCPPIVCNLPDCPSGLVPNPYNPCACPVCAPVDAGQADAPMCARPCPAVRCAYGTFRDPVCGCETCLAPDAGPEAGGGIEVARDALADACLALPCALPLCAPGDVIVDHPCGCPTCERGDASADSGQLACVGLTECACRASDCHVLSEACYCPFPQCGSGSCFCGGGKFIGCAPVGLDTCAAAKKRLADLCPTLRGNTWKGLCQQSDRPCVTKCLNDVGTCDQAVCSFCEGCDCASDAFTTCVSSCERALGR